MSENEINNIHRRMDNQDEILREIRDTLIGHIAEEKDYKPALQDLVSLWKASKIIVPAAVVIWGFVLWVKDHVRL